MHKSKVVMGAGGGCWLLLVALCFGGCQPPTSFEGEAKFRGDVGGCRQRCLEQHLEMASFVYVGEYSTACACKPAQAAGQPLAVGDEEGAIVAAAAGVELERPRAAQQQRAGVMPPP